MADDIPPPPPATPEPDEGVKHARTVSVLAVAELAGKVASFVMFAVAARVLGPDEFGQFSWAINLALLLSAFLIWGFDTALIQIASKAPARLNELLSNVLAIRAMLFPLALLVVVVFPADSGQDLTVSLVMTAAVLADSANQSVRSAAAVLARQRAVAINLVIQRLATAALAIEVLLAGHGVVGMSWAYLAGTLVGVALMFWSGHRIGLSPSVRLVSIATMKEINSGSTALGIWSLLNMLVFRMDTLLLGWILGSGAVGEYTVAYKLFETVLFVIWSVDRVAMPAMAASEGAEPIRNGVHRAVSVVLALFVPYAILLSLRGEQVLTLVFGEPYGVASVAALQLLMASLIPYSLQYLLASGLVAQVRNRTVTISGLVATVVNLAANLALIPVMGIAGAALATFLAMAAQALFLWVFLFRLVGSPRILRAALVPAIAGLAMVPVLLTPLGLFVAAALAAAIYGAVWFVAAARLDPVAKRTLLGLAGIKPRG